MLFPYYDIPNVIPLPYTVKSVKMICLMIFAYKCYSCNVIRYWPILIFQIHIIIAQVGYELPKTNQEVRMTTAAGTFIQLMGSDEQYDLRVFRVALAYNSINHYAPTLYFPYLTGGLLKCTDTWFLPMTFI